MLLTEKEAIWTNTNGTAEVYKGNCLKVLYELPANSVDMIFADPPYFLSNGGVTCQSGKMVSVNKGEWDKSNGVYQDHQFVMAWLEACKRVMKPEATIWVSGTSHIIYSVGFAMQELGFKILNDIIWFKPNAAPNLSCRYFTHSTEILLWATSEQASRHTFNYELMKEFNDGKQMRNLWKIPTTPPKEKAYGRHPTQKPLRLMRRVILSSTNEGNLVLDPFMGSGSTGIAALSQNRRFIGIEIEDEYIEIFIKRTEELGQLF